MPKCRSGTVCNRRTEVVRHRDPQRRQPRHRLRTPQLEDHARLQRRNLHRGSDHLPLRDVRFLHDHRPGDPVSAAQADQPPGLGGRGRRSGDILLGRVFRRGHVPRHAVEQLVLGDRRRAFETSHTFPASALASRSGRRYAYVAACNAEGACSTRGSSRFLPPPPAPRNLDADADGQNAVDLEWRSVTDAEAYEAEYRETSETTWTDADGSTTTTSKTVDGLTCGTEYQFRVRAHGDGTDRSEHWGPWSQTAAADTDACASNNTPGAPTTVTLTVRDRQLEVDWDAPEDIGDTPIDGHQFRYRVNGTERWTESAAHSTSTRVRRSVGGSIPVAVRIIDRLDNGTVYDVEVRVKNGGGYGPWTEQQDVSEAPAAATIAIMNVADASLEAGGSTMFSVRAENLSTVVDYTIRLSTSSTGSDAGVLKFNSCGTNAADSIDFPIGTEVSAVTISGALTVYGCAAGSDNLTATLTGGTGTSPSATQAITVTESASSTSIALTGLSAGFNHVKVSWELTDAPAAISSIEILFQPNPGCTPIFESCPTHLYRIPGLSDRTAERTLPVKMNNDIGMLELPPNTTIRFMVKANYNINGVSKSRESDPWDVTTLPVLGGLRGASEGNNYSEAIWNTTTLSLASTDAGLDPFEFALEVPRESGFQIVNDPATSCPRPLGKSLISCICDYDSWPDTETAWSALPMEHRIVRCSRGDGVTALRTLAREADTGVPVETDKEKIYDKALHQADGVVRFVAASATPVVSPEVDFRGSIATAVALWNEADVDVTYINVTGDDPEPENVTVIEYVWQGMPCQSSPSAVGCVVFDSIHIRDGEIRGTTAMTIANAKVFSTPECDPFVWSSSATMLENCQISLLHAFAHEFGHAAGVYESADDGDIMYAYIDPGQIKLTTAPGTGFGDPFGTQEISAMNALYPSGDEE